MTKDLLFLNNRRSFVVNDTPQDGMGGELRGVFGERESFSNRVENFLLSLRIFPRASR